MYSKLTWLPIHTRRKDDIKGKRPNAKILSTKLRICASHEVDPYLSEALHGAIMLLEEMENEKTVA